MHVAALDKPAGMRCEHQGQAANRGCGIYEQRPSACRNWYCMWVRDSGTVFTDEERPDKLGVFFTVAKRTSSKPSRLAGLATPIEETDEQVIYAHPIRPGGERGVAARVVINRLRRYFPVHILPFRYPPKFMNDAAQVTPLTKDGAPVPQGASTA